MLDTVFLVCAAVGGLTFALRTVMMLLGIGVDHDISDGFDLDAAGDHDGGVQLLSVQAIAAFLMMFGLVGLALHRESEASAPLALFGALAAGFASMLLVAWLFKLMSRIQSSGNLDLARAIGQEGVVYLTIRPSSGGQVQVTVQGKLGVFDAEAAGSVEIATGRSVRVVGVRSGVLIVEAVPGA